jgi:hypothetical protein
MGIDPAPLFWVCFGYVSDGWRWMFGRFGMVPIAGGLGRSRIGGTAAVCHSLKVFALGEIHDAIGGDAPEGVEPFGGDGQVEDVAQLKARF